MMGGDRGQTPAAKREDAGSLGLDPPPGLPVIHPHDQLLPFSAHLQRERALARLGKHLLGREPPADLPTEP